MGLGWDAQLLAKLGGLVGQDDATTKTKTNYEYYNQSGEEIANLFGDKSPRHRCQCSIRRIHITYMNHMLGRSTSP
jgi:hypothetical protein